MPIENQSLEEIWEKLKGIPAIESLNVKCVERDGGFFVHVRCKNEKCLTHCVHTPDGICKICEKKCKGLRTIRAFHFRPEDIGNVKVRAEIADYQCKNCGCKEYLTPFISQTNLTSG